MNRGSWGSGQGPGPWIKLKPGVKKIKPGNSGGKKHKMGGGVFLRMSIPWRGKKLCPKDKGIEGILKAHRTSTPFYPGGPKKFLRPQKKVLGAFWREINEFKSFFPLFANVWANQDPPVSPTSSNPERGKGGGFGKDFMGFPPASSGLIQSGFSWSLFQNFGPFSGFLKPPIPGKRLGGVPRPKGHVFAWGF